MSADDAHWFTEDGRLMEELRSALVEDAPPAPLGMLMAGYEIVMADTVPATLVHDSAVDEVAAVRSGLADARLLTFEADGLAVEFELHGGRIIGHIDPPRPGVMHLDQPTETEGRDPVTPDDLGAFEFDLRAPGSFRLRFVDDAGVATSTGWVDGPHETLS